MRILLGNTGFYPKVGGIENYLLNVGRVLVGQGHQATVLTWAYDTSLAAEADVEGIGVIRFPHRDAPPPLGLANRGRYLRASRRAARRLLAAKAFDVAWMRDPVICHGLLACRRRPPILYIQATAYPVFLDASRRRTARGGLRAAYVGLYRRIVRDRMLQVERRIVAGVEVLAVLSAAKRAEICAFYGLPEAAYHVVPAGVDTQRYHPALQDEKRRLRRRLGLPVDRFLFLYVGRFSVEKNPQGFLEAMEALPADAPVAGVMVGPAGKAFLERLAASPRKDRIALCGQQAEPVEYYRACDAFVLPSLSEGFGQVLLEAMACGLPCVGYAPPPGQSVLATAEIVEQGRTGLLAAYADAKALSAAMGRLSANPALAREMGERGRRRAVDEYSWTAVVEKLLALSRSMADVAKVSSEPNATERSGRTK